MLICSRCNAPSAAVVLSQALAQAVGFNTNDRIGVLIEGLSSTEDLETYGVFLDMDGLARKQSFA